jgi:hypothetical protein
MIQPTIKINPPPICESLDYMRQEVLKFTDKYKPKVVVTPIKQKSKDGDKKSKKHRHRR